MQAVIFDRDGVILNSEHTNITSAEEAFKQLGIKITEEDKKHIVAKHPDDYNPYFQNKYVFRYKQFRKLQRENYYKLFSQTPVFEEIVDLIEQLYRESIPLGLTTSSSRRSTNILLNRLDLTNHFKAIVTSDDCKDRKPAPEPYLLTAKKLGVEPEECAVIEDSDIGAASAKAAGMICIALPNKYTKNQDFTSADKVAKSPKDIELYLRQNITLSATS